jgi:hypothetical protein
MKNMQMKMMMVLVAGVSVMALNGCGSGTQIVKTLSFSAAPDTSTGDLMAGFDAQVTLGQGSLPDATLPIFNPNVPVQTLGYITTSSTGLVSLRVDVTQAAKVHVTDGTLLPNGNLIPVTLPAGVVPIAIPVINSNSKVYLAIGSQNIMAGVAVTLAANNATSTTNWLQILQSLPANLFYTFTINPTLKGTAGVFTGTNVGIGIFAVQTLGKAPTTTTTVAANVSMDSATVAPKLSAQVARSRGFAIRSLAAVTEAPAASTTAPEVFGLHTQHPTGSRLNKIQRALLKVRSTRLD